MFLPNFQLTANIFLDDYPYQEIDTSSIEYTKPKHARLGIA